MIEDLAVDLEITKLAHDLRCDRGALAALHDLDLAEVRELRAVLSASRFARHEARFRRVAGVPAFLPMAVCARVAEAAIGPMISARVASLMDPDLAVRLAARLPSSFLARLTRHLDPARTAPIVGGLPHDLVVEVGRRLLVDDETITLGRFVAMISLEATLDVVATASPQALLDVALYAEDAAALERVVAALPTPVVQGIIRAALDSGREDQAVVLIASLTPASRARLIDALHELELDARRAFVRAVIRQQAWEHVLPALHLVSAESLHSLVNLPEVADPAAFAAAAASR